jgi:hypothetical protein
MIDCKHSACSVLGYRLTQPASVVNKARRICGIKTPSRSIIIVSDREAERSDGPSMTATQGTAGINPARVLADQTPLLQLLVLNL